MPYSTISFDIDGTLTASAPAILYSLRNALLATIGKDYSYEELHSALAAPSYITLQKFAGDRWKEAAHIGQTYYMEALNKVSLFPNMEKTIFNLHKKGTRLGIVTSKTRIQLGRSFVNYSIYPCFEHIICEDDTPFHKPDPRPLLECINRFHANPTSTLFIGDTFSDSECAHHAGIDFGLASWGCQDSASIKTDVVLNSPEDLLKYV